MAADAASPLHLVHHRATPLVVFEDVRRRRPVGAQERLLSLDVFRGITIAAMLFVNNPGTTKFDYPLLQHAEWDGCRPADLIFPFFLFIVGVSITYSFTKLADADRRAVVLKVARRSLIIFGIGLFLNALPYFDWEITRVPGVLQRIALCYCAASLIALFTRVRGQALAVLLLLAGYSVAMQWIPVPGHGAGILTPDANLAAYVDRTLMAGHLWRSEWDPEGLLATIPATATTLVGVLAGHWLLSPRRPMERVVGLLVAGGLGMVLGLALNPWVPINKPLWSSSFVLLAGGAALLSLALCYWFIDLKGYRGWAIPCVVFGTNAILAYALSTLLTKALALWTVVRPDGTSVVLKTYLFQRYFLPIASHRHASLLYALTHVVVWWACMSVLYRRRIFFKI